MITILIEANSPGIPCCRRQGQLRNMTSSYHEGILLASLRPTRLWNTVTVLLQNPSDSCIILRPCVLASYTPLICRPFHITHREWLLLDMVAWVHAASH